jgi:large subunit ribosomal protein L18
MKTEEKHRLRQLRHWRIRKKVVGTAERPRLSVRFTQKNIHVQFIDDTKGVTLAAVSTTSPSVPQREQIKSNVAGAAIIGKLAAAAAQARGITQVVFDRGGAKFHGKVKALADAAREAGLKF